MDAIASNAEMRITMTAEPLTLLDLVLGLMLLIALVAIVVNVIALLREYFGKKK